MRGQAKQQMRCLLPVEKSAQHHEHECKHHALDAGAVAPLWPVASAARSGQIRHSSIAPSCSCTCISSTAFASRSSSRCTRKSGSSSNSSDNNESRRLFSSFTGTATPPRVPALRRRYICCTTLSQQRSSSCSAICNCTSGSTSSSSSNSNRGLFLTPRNSGCVSPCPVNSSRASRDGWFARNSSSSSETDCICESSTSSSSSNNNSGSSSNNSNSGKRDCIFGSRHSSIERTSCKGSISRCDNYPAAVTRSNVTLLLKRHPPLTSSGSFTYRKPPAAVRAALASSSPPCATSAVVAPRINSYFIPACMPPAPAGLLSLRTAAAAPAFRPAGSTAVPPAEAGDATAATTVATPAPTAAATTAAAATAAAATAAAATAAAATAAAATAAAATAAAATAAAATAAAATAAAATAAAATAAAATAAANASTADAITMAAAAAVVDDCSLPAASLLIRCVAAVSRCTGISTRRRRTVAAASFARLPSAAGAAGSFPLFSCGSATCSVAPAAASAAFKAALSFSHFTAFCRTRFAEEGLRGWLLLQQRRGVARLKGHRYGGVVALKTRAPKSPWYLEAEKTFLQERRQIPDGYVDRWQGEDLCRLSPRLRRCLHLRCASGQQLHKWRKLQLSRLLQRRPFDTGSPAVQLACLTETILNVRAHLLQHVRDQQKKRLLSILLSRRQRIMKYLYRTDLPLYKHACHVLRLKCVRFAIPDSRDRQHAISPVAVDGDRCKFLIRQKLWKAKYRPRPVKQADGKLVRYTRHPMEQPPSSWNLPHEHRPNISRAWPYGVREERIRGDYVIANPTAAGLGYCPAPLFF